ncbi:glycoside hydrolase 3 protein [Coniosporium apollinis]|uniref:glucan 1,3-beta-glucosidase n=2 Tax=Coniosporium TaxID=2810619 RepID=A0ABQ9NWB0_9PEZI|nr:glycoside hydrolase 3 protein [Cladosporium sp. JES 115]KAJ9663768.1 glycoside hydrolase 3 protein [Coniosporium apollinis]
MHLSLPLQAAHAALALSSLLAVLTLPILSLLAPAAARGTLGFALGTKNADGSCKTTADYQADFDAIYAASGSTLVRGYSASDCDAAARILPAAASKGFKAVLGVWPDVPSSLAADTAALQAHAWRYPDQLYAVTVGSEALYRGNFTGEELLEKINGVKAVLPPGVRVGTADSWNKWADGTGDAVVRGGVDIIMVNAFAYWQAQEIGNATKTYFHDIARAFERIQDISGSFDRPELWNGETGWPKDGGSDFGAALASTVNAHTYFQTAVCGMLAWNVDVFYFEAFDEPWKPRSEGDNGVSADETHWGAMTAGREVSYAVRCVAP